MQKINKEHPGGKAAAYDKAPFPAEWRFCFEKRDGDMDKYNPEHYIDLTAAIAVSRADRRKTIAFVARGGSYRIGDIYRFEWKNGVFHIWEYK